MVLDAFKYIGGRDRLNEPPNDIEATLPASVEAGTDKNHGLQSE
jgi:hypothetical protein